jgi:Flp pilus assembly pilin Flp
MHSTKRIVTKLHRSSGQTMTEYALILATIAAVIVSLYSTSGTVVRSLVNQVGALL